jgi:hypothetical protein
VDVKLRKIILPIFVQSLNLTHILSDWLLRTKPGAQTHPGPWSGGHFIPVLLGLEHVPSQKTAGVENEKYSFSPQSNISAENRNKFQVLLAKLATSKPTSGNFFTATAASFIFHLIAIGAC